jgi:hypothetical protein
MCTPYQNEYTPPAPESFREDPPPWPGRPDRAAKPSPSLQPSPPAASCSSSSCCQRSRTADIPGRDLLLRRQNRRGRAPLHGFPYEYPFTSLLVLIVAAPSRISVKAPALYGVGPLLSRRLQYIPTNPRPSPGRWNLPFFHPGGLGVKEAVLSARYPSSSYPPPSRRRWPSSRPLADAAVVWGVSSGSGARKVKGEAGIGAWRSARSRAGRPRRGPTGPRPAW